MNSQVEEILDYLKVTTKDNTSKEQFNKDMDKYRLDDIFEAFCINRENEEEAYQHDKQAENDYFKKMENE
jgi:hypothetical protein